MPETTLTNATERSCIYDACKPLPRRSYHFGTRKRESPPRSGAFVLALMLAAFALGLYLARFGVLAVLVATALSSAASFTYDLMDGSTLIQIISLSLFMGFVVQVGYLVGQVMLSLRR